MIDYDIVICGGGLIGRSLALALARLKLRVAVLEAISPTLSQQADFDSRSFAISYGNSRLLTELGIWQRLNEAATPITNIHVSDRGHWGLTRLSARELEVPALGYIVLAPALNLALQQAVDYEVSIDFFCPASVNAVEFKQDKAILTYQSHGEQKTMAASLLVAADGMHSTLRKLLHIDTVQYDYEQTAIISNIGLTRSHANTAYERFTTTGPLALLPLSEQRCGLVWSLTPDLASQALAQSDSEFLQQLQRAFGYRLGRLAKVGKRFAYPLHLIQAKQLFKERVVLVGNAAHTLHPVAGQGFNLGLRDVVALTQVIATTPLSALGSKASLQRFATQQAQDHASYIRMTDGLIKLFANSFVTHVTARNLALNTFNLLPDLRKSFARRAMGLDMG
jgi:2-octaprenyl-6-methoxyphenol hydroxylase